MCVQGFENGILALFLFCIIVKCTYRDEINKIIDWEYGENGVWID